MGGEGESIGKADSKTLAKAGRSFDEPTGIIELYAPPP